MPPKSTDNVNASAQNPTTSPPQDPISQTQPSSPPKFEPAQTPSLPAQQPPPQPTAQTTQPHQNSPPPEIVIPKSTRKIYFSALVIILLILVSIFGGGIALAYNNYKLFNPPKPLKKALDNFIIVSPLPKPTRIVLESAILKSASLKSADQKTQMSLSTDSTSSPISSIKLNLSGPVDFEGENKQASEADIGLEVKMEGASFNGSASVKNVKNIIYVKVNEIPFGQIYQELLSLKDKWYYWEIPEKYLPGEETLEKNEKINTILATFMEKTREWTKITSNEGTNYTLEINPPKEELTSLIYDIISAYGQQDDQKLTTDLEKEKISKTLNKLENVKITAKVNKDNYYLSRADISFDIIVDDLSLPTSAESLTPQQSATFKFKLTTELSNYNKQAVIIPPADAISLTDAYRDLSAKYSAQIQTENENLPQNLSPLLSPPQPTPQPTEEDLNRELENDQTLKDLLSPGETVLGQKFNWEKELLKLFAKILR